MRVSVTRILQLCYNYSHNYNDLSKQIIHAYDSPEYQLITAYLTGSPPDEPLPFEQYFFQFSKRELKGSRRAVIEEILKFCAQRKFQVVITHRFKPTHIMAYVIRQIPFHKAISVVHRRGSFQRWQRRLFSRFLLRKHWTFIAVSDAVNRDLLIGTGLSPKQVFTIYNAIDVYQIQKQQLGQKLARKQFGLSENDYIFGCVARLVPTKGHIYLLQAFKQFLAEQTEPHRFRLVLMGSGRNELNLKQSVKTLDIESQVLFTGDVAQAFCYMRMFNVFILPSLNEGFGMVLLEAIAAKRPIIATQAGGIPEVLGADFDYIPTQDADALYQQMKAIEQQSCQQQQADIDKLYQRLIDKFDIQRYQKQFRALIDNS